MTFLFNIYKTKNNKKPFVIDVIDAVTESEARQKLINKTYFLDSDQKIVLGTCRKLELINII